MTLSPQIHIYDGEISFGTFELNIILLYLRPPHFIRDTEQRIMQ